MKRKNFILDTNVMVGYFVENKFAIINELKNKSYPIQFFLPNIVIAEVYKVFSRKIVEEGLKLEEDPGKSKFYGWFEKFSSQISRRDQWLKGDKAPTFINLDFQRYHLLNCQHIFHFLIYFNKENNCEVGNIDMLIVGQAIELTRLLGRENIALLTNDSNLVKFGRYLNERNLDQRKKLAVPQFIEYPNIIRVTDNASIEEFLKEL